VDEAGSRLSPTWRFAEIKRDGVADVRNDRLLLHEIKAALSDYLQVDEVLDAKVRRKIASLSGASRKAAPSGTCSTAVPRRRKRKLGADLTSSTTTSG